MKVKIKCNEHDTDMVEMYSVEPFFLMCVFHEDNLTGTNILSVLRNLDDSESEFVECVLLEEGEVRNNE